MLSAERDPALAGVVARRRRARGARRWRRRPTRSSPRPGRRSRARCRRRRDRLGQLLDAGPRRGGVLPLLAEAIRFLSNRGANGIDGVISSAAGAARATGAPVTVLTGELALLHDLGGLLAAARARHPAHGGVRQQRRRRHLRLPAGGGRGGRGAPTRSTSPRRRAWTWSALAALGHGAPLASTADEVRAAVASAGPGGVPHRPRRQRAAAPEVVERVAGAAG